MIITAVDIAGNGEGTDMARVHIVRAISLAAVIAGACLPARADIVVQTAPVAVQRAVIYARPSAILLPGMVTTRYYDSTRVLTQPAVIVPHPTTSARIEAVEQTISEPALITTTTVASTRMENFKARLDAIGDQITLAESNGWLAPGVAETLRTRRDSLSAANAGFLSRGYMSTSENNWLEKQINLLNQDVAAAMHI